VICSREDWTLADNNGDWSSEQEDWPTETAESGQHLSVSCIAVVALICSRADRRLSLFSFTPVWCLCQQFRTCSSLACIHTVKLGTVVIVNCDISNINYGYAVGVRSLNGRAIGRC